MQRSWVVTIVLGLAATAAISQGTRAADRAAVTPQAASSAAAKPVKHDTKATKAAPAAAGHVTTPGIS